MRKIVKGFVFCTAISLWSMTLWQFVNAQPLPGQNLVSKPFIATDRADSPDFLSAVVSTGKRSPYLFRSLSPNPADNTFNGLLIESDHAVTPMTVNHFELTYKGNANSDVVVQYNHIPDHSHGAAHLATTSAPLSAGTTKSISADGFKNISFTAKQLGLPENNAIQRIAIVPPSAGRSKLQVDDIRVNLAAVDKVMDSLFFRVSAGASSGPVPPATKQGKLKGVQPGATAVTVTNTTSQSCVAWLTLPTVCTPNSQCLLDVRQIFPQMVCVQGGCFQGSQTLAPGQTISYTPGPNPPGIQGALLSFNAAPNCGFTNFEFTINNVSQSPQFAQETVNISVVNGNNAAAKFTLNEGSGAKWTTNFGTKPYNGPFQNYAGDNLNVIGVFPKGCTNCTFLTGPPVCGFTPTQCSGANGSICQPPDPVSCPQYCSFQRPASQAGGTVTISYLGTPTALPTQNLKLKQILAP